MKLIKTLAFSALLLLLSVSANADLSITNLVDDQAVRANNGVVTLKVSSTVPFILYIDDNEVSTYSQIISGGLLKEGTTADYSFAFKDVDRGTHTFRVVSVYEADEVTIHVLRTHN